MGVLGFRRAVLLSTLLICGVAHLAGAETKGGLSEQELKAAALNQVVHFVRWPSGAFLDANSPLTIGIFGEDPFGTLIDELVRGETVSGHPIRVVRCFTPEAAAACHVVYVSDPEHASVDRLLRALGDRNVLAVGDDEAFVEHGGTISLTVRNNRIRILVNLESAKKSNVTLSSKLLRLAEIVKQHSP